MQRAPQSAADKETFGLHGEVVSLSRLDAEERQLLEDLRAFLEKDRDWNAYSNFKVQKIGGFYEQQGLTRAKIVKTPLFRVAQDLGSRLAIELGLAQAPNPKPDYREQLSRLIREKYHTRRGFCQETGISEDLLSHVLAGRKHLAIDTLTSALARIGYRLEIVPANGDK